MRGDRDDVVSIEQAAALRRVSREAISKAIRSGRLYAYSLSGKGMMLSGRQVTGKKFSEPEFKKLCQQYVCVPDACEIMRLTDAAVIRKAKAGVVKGFKLNPKCWAILKSSAEQEYRDYLEENEGRVGRKRNLSGSRSPRSLRKKSSLQKQ